MRRAWLIASYEYRRIVLRKRFFWVLVSAPAFLVVILILTTIGISLGMNTAPIGYVDSGNALGAAGESSRGIVRIADETAARAALDGGKIQAYYVLPPGYRQSHKVNLVFVEEPDSITKAKFETFFKVALLASQPKDIAERVALGPSIRVHATQENRETQHDEWFKIAVPVAAGVLLVFVIFLSSAYLVQAVVDEKENRTMEVLATSASPAEIMAGKILGLTGVALTQFGVWSALPVTLGVLAILRSPDLVSGLNWTTAVLALLVTLPAFITIAAWIAAIGVVFSKSGDGQQLTLLITIPLYVPIMLLEYLIAQPSSPAALILSFFPLTAALTLLIRMGAQNVPTWQLVASIVLQSALAAGSLWAASRIFRWGMLRNGVHLSVRKILARLRKSQ